MAKCFLTGPSKNVYGVQKQNTEGTKLQAHPEISVTSLQGPGKYHKGLKQAGGDAHRAPCKGGEVTADSTCLYGGIFTTQHQARGSALQGHQVFGLFKSSWKSEFLCEV